MPWNGSISWSNGDLVASSKLVDMVENEDWAKGLADRVLVGSISYGPFTRDGAASLGGWEIDVTIGGVTKTDTGVAASPVLLTDWDASALTGEFGEHTVDVRVVLRVQISGGSMFVVLSHTHRVVLPNESGVIRYTNMSVNGSVKESQWIFDEPGPSYRLGTSFLLDVWVHNNDWTDDWSPEV